MRREDIHVGHVYIARVNKRFTTVKVDGIVSDTSRYSGVRNAVTYHVTNLLTGKKLAFRSALRFRGVAREGAIPFATTVERVVPHMADERKVSVEEILPITNALELLRHGEI